MGNVYKPIAIFDYKNSKYCIVMVNNRICFFKHENDQIKPAYSKEELELFLAVHNSIKVDTKDHTPLRIEKVGDRDFEIFYDKNTGLHYWTRVNGDRRLEATEEDNVILNFKYNNIRQTVFDEELFDWAKEEQRQIELAKARKNKEIIRTISIGASIFVFGLFAGVNIANYSSAPIAQDLRIHLAEMGINVESKINPNEPYEQLIERLANQPYDYEDIQSAIDKNKNLSDDEKAFLNKFKFLFDENHQYMDIKEARKNLLTLKFKFIDAECVYPGVKGFYNRTNNEITIYNAKDINSSNIANVTHELMHVFQMNSTDRITSEFSDEILSREVLRRLDEQGLIENSEAFEDDLGCHTRYGNGYDPCMTIGYMFANLLTPEQLKIYHFTCREDYLIDTLVDIDLNGSDVKQDSIDKEALTKKAVQLLDVMESLRVSDINGEYVKVTYSPERAKIIVGLIDPYYKAKYGTEADKYLDATIINLDKVNVTRAASSDCQLWSATITIINTLAEQLGITDNDVYELMNKKYYTSMYVVPKTYYCDAHPTNKIVVEAQKPYEIEIDDKFIEKYEQEYDKSKEALRKYEEAELKAAENSEKENDDTDELEY